MKFTNTLNKPTLQQDYQKLKQVLTNKSNNSNHLKSITNYVTLFIQKHNLVDDSIISLELEDLYNKFKQTLILN